MSREPEVPAAIPAPGESPAGETELGRALALIHRVLPRLDDTDRTDGVQQALRQAAALVEAARVAHQSWAAARKSGDLDGETLALIAAAVSAVLGRPHRVLGVEKTPVTVAWVNAWAIEGRFQHYSSHKVR